MCKLSLLFARTKLLARNLQRSYNIARVKAGLSEVRWHDLRHTLASRMVQCDTPLYIVQKLLGHKDQRMTQRYSHLTVKALRRGVDILGHNSVIVGQSEKEKEYISS
ncbi:MAG: tyrosine-type recombinase/integrase [Nitrospiria bacterium]